MQLGRFRKIEALKAKYFVLIFRDSKISSKTDGTRHYLATIVIDVLADQIDTAGTKKNIIWFFLEALLKFFFYIRHCIFKFVSLWINPFNSALLTLRVKIFICIVCAILI